MLEAQEKAARSMAEGMQAMLAGKLPTIPVDTDGLAQATEALTQLWSAATAMSSELAGKLKDYAGDGASSALYERMTDPRQWMVGTGELDDVLTRLSDAPRLADLWDLERRSARMLKAWSELRRQSFEQQRVVLAAWLQAGRTYTQELAAQAGADGKPLEPKQAFRLWTEVANRHLLQTQRSEAFLKSQADMIRASTELRLAQSDLGEYVGKRYGLPTRTELDDVHRTLTEVRRELRRVRRALAETQSAPAAPTARVATVELRTSKRKARR
jgi:hypothetical protein